MKCIKNIKTGEVSRIADHHAKARVEAGTHTDIGKVEYKAATRPANWINPEVAKVEAKKIKEAAKQAAQSFVSID